MNSTQSSSISFSPMIPTFTQVLTFTQTPTYSLSPSFSSTSSVSASTTMVPSYNFTSSATPMATPMLTPTSTPSPSRSLKPIPAQNPTILSGLADSAFYTIISIIICIFIINLSYSCHYRQKYKMEKNKKIASQVQVNPYNNVRNVFSQV